MQTMQMTAAERAAIAASPRVQDRMREIERMAAQSRRPTQPKADERSIAERIADDMIDIAGVTDCARDKDLIGRGWTPAALAQHGDEANRIALARAGNAR